ncbi:MAG: hypothetical protein M1334_00610 [Patescibacteria group bacterium]|nr:hypothetical protein [Patescibacteria group bacterium]
MSFQNIQNQYDKIYSYFKTTSEPFDLLEWDGELLNVWGENEIFEIYKYKDLKALKIF